LPNGVISLDPMGKPKPKCVMGEKADCSRCGCIVPYQDASVAFDKSNYL